MKLDGPLFIGHARVGHEEQKPDRLAARTDGQRSHGDAAIRPCGARHIDGGDDGPPRDERLRDMDLALLRDLGLALLAINLLRKGRPET